MDVAFDIQTAADADRRTLILRGEMDMESAPMLRNALESACADGAREVVLDLREVDFIDSTGLQALVAGRGFCGEHDCRYFIGAGLPDRVRRLLAVTGVASQFDFR